MCDQINLSGFDVPDAFASGRILDHHFTPRLRIKGRTVRNDLIHATRGVLGPLGFAGRAFDPDAEIGGNLADALLPKTIQLKDKIRDFAVFLIEGDIIKTKPFGHHVLDLLNADLPFGTIGDFIGDARTPAAIPICIPALRQIQIAGDNATERVYGVVVRVKQVLTDDAVVPLAGFAAPLTLHTGRVFALLDVSGGIENADGSSAMLMVNHLANEDAVGTLVVPSKEERNSCNVRTATPLARAIGSMDLRFKSAIRPNMYFCR